MTSGRARNSRPWLKVAKTAIASVREEIKSGRMSLRAGGLAFFVFLSAFPAIALLGAIYGLVFSPQDVAAQASQLGGAVPQSVVVFLTEPLEPLSGSDTGTLGIGAVVGFVATVWTARRGSTALIRAINLAYGLEDRRGPLHDILAGLLLSVVSVIVGALTVASLALLPIFLKVIGIDPNSAAVIQGLRWPIVYAALTGTVALIYWYAPNRSRPSFRRTLPAAALVAVALLVGSAGMTWLIGAVMNQERTYGSLASVATVLLWLYASSWVVLMGAELSAAVERMPTRT